MVGAVKETIDQLLPYGTLDTLGHSSLDGHRRMHARTHSRVHTLTHSLTLLGTKHRVQTALDRSHWPALHLTCPKVRQPLSSYFQTLWANAPASRLGQSG